ncbi:eukaryotic translation initiation factor 2B subunit epsilon [Lycorma delicatula]|uniref:eukaryotic translation initiation factor 2B subunit epsilon n=1 Tax=Lycorma delicatula TaxID=130591 RepID=UPI003F511033
MAKNTSTRWKKEEIVQAVVIADSFSDHFTPFSKTLPPCLIPLANCPLLEYTLSCLSSGGVNEVILFCSSFSDQIKSFISKRDWGDMVITVVVSEGCRSFGDAMRDLDTKALIRSDFILVTGFLVANLPFEHLLKKHSEFRKLDQPGQSIAMTLLYKDGGRRESSSDEVTFAMDSKSNQILWINKHSSKSAKMKIPMEIILNYSQVNICHGLLNTKVYICSSSVPPLFSDNFDFETADDFIRGLLMNEEILASTLYCHFLPCQNYAATVSNWVDYQTVTHDVIHRWVYPVVPDAGFPYGFQRHSVYLGKNVTLSLGCQLLQDVMIGSGCFVGEKTSIDCSVLGKNCHVGNNVKLEGCYLFNDIVVEDGCTLSYCVIGDNCRIKAGSSVSHGSILGPDVVIDLKKQISGVRLQATQSGSGDEGKLGSKAFISSLKEEDSGSESDDEDKKSTHFGGPGLRIQSNVRRENFDEIVESSESDADSSDLDSPELDDTNIFYNEVLDSLIRGYTEKLPCDNLILEINSSRYAYNVTLKELNCLVVKAILNLPNDKTTPALYWDELKKRIIYFDPVLKKYIRSTDSQKDCLLAIEDVAESLTRLQEVLIQLIHFLYNQDILYADSIDWWYENPSGSIDVNIAEELRAKVKKFVLWLRELESTEESSESD